MLVEQLLHRLTWLCYYFYRKVLDIPYVSIDTVTSIAVSIEIIEVIFLDN